MKGENLKKKGETTIFIFSPPTFDLQTPETWRLLITTVADTFPIRKLELSLTSLVILNSVVSLTLSTTFKALSCFQTRIISKDQKLVFPNRSQRKSLSNTSFSILQFNFLFLSAGNVEFRTGITMVGRLVHWCFDVHFTDRNLTILLRGRRQSRSVRTKSQFRLLSRIR